MGFFQTIPGRFGSLTDFLYINLDCYELLGQPLDGRQQHNIKLGAHVDTFTFFAPNEIQESLKHYWENYETVTGKASAIVAEGKNMVHQAGGWYSGGASAYETRADTPLIYEKSERRSINFTIEMLDQDSPKSIWAAADAIRQYSCARAGGEQAGGAIEKVFPPYIWSVKTSPVDVINFRWAALTDVQNSYNFPFMEPGYPSSIKMTLTFLDLEPTFADSFHKGAAITTN